MKAVVAAINQEKALVGAFSVIRNLRMDNFEALGASVTAQQPARIYRARPATKHLNGFCWPGPGRRAFERTANNHIAAFFTPWF